MNLIEAIGWIGSFIYIVAYFLLAYKFIQKGKFYYLLNKLAAALIIVISMQKGTIQPIVINTLWLFISYLGYNNIHYDIKFLNKYIMHISSIFLVSASVIANFIFDYTVAFDILAWLSVVAFSGSYFLYSTKKINERTFHFYNFLAAVTIIPKMYIFDNFQVVTLEILWAVFALHAFIKVSNNDDYLTLAS